jgi:type II secretory pathway pseudopilin PulG
MIGPLRSTATPPPPAVLRRRPSCRPAFTLVEALVSTTIMALAAAVLLLGVQTSLDTTSDALDQTIANGMARQLVDEVMGQSYMIPGGSPYDYPLGPSSWEAAGQGRERFNDSDDYNGYAARPAKDIWGVEMGQGDGVGGLRHANFRLRSGYFADWRQAIQVYYVSDADPSQRLAAGQTSNSRAVDVAITRRLSDGSEFPLANLRRVYSYVPPPK